MAVADDARKLIHGRIVARGAAGIEQLASEEGHVAEPQVRSQVSFRPRFEGELELAVG